MFPAFISGGCTYGQLQPARAKRIKETAVHPLHTEEAHIAVKVIREDALGAELFTHRAKLPGNFSNGLIPADRHKSSLPFRANPLQRLCQPVRMLRPFACMPHLVANRSFGHRMLRVALYLDELSVLFVQQQPAGIRTIERAYRGKDSVLYVLHVSSLPSLIANVKIIA